MKFSIVGALLFIGFLCTVSASPLDVQHPNVDDVNFVRRIEFEDKVNQLQNTIEALTKKLDDISSAKHQQANIDWDRVPVSANPKVLGPTSCLELWRINQTETGYHLVRSPDGKKINVIYCEQSSFTENLMGYLDVKKEAIFFAGSRAGEYKNGNNQVTLTYPSNVVAHTAFNNLAGRFTAPVAGVYQFSFYNYAYGHGDAGESTSNGARVILLIDGIEADVQNYASSDRPANMPLSFMVTIHLNKNQYVETRFKYGNIRDCHFTGVLLEADLE